MEMRERILRAAIECLTREGYRGTTTLAVQERAGVSRGALLHYFSTRDELVVAAVGHLFEAITADFRSRVDLESGEAERIGGAIDLLWGTFRGPLFEAALELWVAARTDQDLLAVLVPHERRLGREIRQLCGDLFGEVSAHPRFDEVYEVGIQAMRGAALSSIVGNRALGQEPFIEHLKDFARAMLLAGEL